MTRRDAEMAVERLVQEHGIDRTDIFVAAAGNENSAGEQTAGSDAKGGKPSPQGRDDATLNGPIEVSVSIEDETQVSVIRDAFAEFHTHGVEQKQT